MATSAGILWEAMPVMAFLPKTRGELRRISREWRRARLAFNSSFALQIGISVATTGDIIIIQENVSIGQEEIQRKESCERQQQEPRQRQRV